MQYSEYADKPLYSSQAYIDTPTLLDDTTNGLPENSQRIDRSHLQPDNLG